MPDAIIAALITGAVSLIGVVVTVLLSNRGLLAKLDKQSEVADEKLRGEINVIKTEISELKEETRKHNGLIDRTYELEKRMGVAEIKQKTADHRIENLEGRLQNNCSEKTNSSPGTYH